jgi:hypothetical protein
MTVEVIIFGAGAILIIIGVMGGGFEVKEIKRGNQMGHGEIKWVRPLKFSLISNV